MEVLGDVLQQAGLDKIEAEVYSTLLNNGGLTVLELANAGNLKRTNLYNVLAGLEEKGLVNKITKGKGVRFYANSPREVQKFFDIREDQLNLAKSTFNILVDSLQSKYVLQNNKPAITYLEGLSGLQKLYQDVLDTGKDIMLIRSTYDDKRKDVDKLIKAQVTEQAKRNIHSRVISPFETDAKEMYTKYDKIRLVEQRFASKFDLFLPAQILIYGNKTSITTVRKDIIITLIDNPDITNTFKVIFEFMWQYLKPEHEALVKAWKA